MSAHILNGQIEINFDETKKCSVITLHAGKYSGAQYGYAGVKFEELEGGGVNLVFTWFPMNLLCPEDDDFKQHIGEVLRYLMLAEANLLEGSDMENFDLTKL